MLSNIRKRKAQGFTIIEVLIVLAIAGLILLVVFLAVPALQRNARNTQRNNDVATALGAVSEYVNNNNGTLPTTAAVAVDGTLTISGAVGTNNVTSKLGYYKTVGNVTMTTAPAAATNATTTDTLTIYTGADCTAAGTQAVAGQSRGIAATYTLETAAKECKAS